MLVYLIGRHKDLAILDTWPIHRQRYFQPYDGRGATRRQGDGASRLGINGAARQ